MKLQESNFEPICHNYLAHGSIQDAMAISTAASLKRIADALEGDKVYSNAFSAAWSVLDIDKDR